MKNGESALYSPRAFYQVLSGARLTGERLEQVVHRRLQEVLVLAYRQVPYQRERMRSANYDPTCDYSGPEDLSDLPVTTRQMLKNQGVRPFVREDTELTRLYKDGTSGSTGIPLTVYRGYYERSVQVAKWFRVLFANGYSIRHRVMSLTSPARMGVGKSPVQRFGLFRRRAVDYRLPPKDMTDEFLTQRPDVLYGNRCNLELMVQELRSRGIRHDDLKLLVVTGMPIDESFRQLSRIHFGVEPIDSYGSVELGAMAYETPERDGLHLTQDLVYFEFLDDQGGQVGPGKPSRIVVTDLTNKVMPWIRYELEDTVQYTWTESRQGTGERRLTKIDGRESDSVLLPDGSRRPYHTFVPYIQALPTLLQLQIVQLERDLIRVLLVMDTEEFVKAKPALKRRLSQDLPASMRLEVQRVDRIEPDSSGKRRLIVNRLGK
jgi:phenylacetate-CoA ligase